MPMKRRPPGPTTFTANGDTVEQAAERAWDKAKKAGHKAGWYQIVSIYFYADNPIRDYKVVIGGGS